MTEKSAFVFFLINYYFILLLLNTVFLGVVKKGVHGPGPYFDEPGPRRGSMDQGSMFCTFLIITCMATTEKYW